MGYWDRIRPVDGVVSYDGDFVAWAFDQARRVRELRSNDIDAEHIAEELEDLGKSQYDAAESYLTLILLHMLKWDHQPNHRGPSWRKSVRAHRRNLEKKLRKMPSLRATALDMLPECYDEARADAADETGLPERFFPDTCPYDWDTIMNRELRLDDPE